MRGKSCRTLVESLVLLVMAACATLVVGGIPPSSFEFHGIVPLDTSPPGGWKVAQIVIMLGHLSESGPQPAWCDVEVGVPEYNIDGPVLDVEAQELCALAADRAAQVALKEQGLASAVLCRRFISEMEAFLRQSIKGATVTKFRTPGISPKRYPEGQMP
jgi:hypothetical protein